MQSTIIFSSRTVMLIVNHMPLRFKYFKYLNILNGVSCFAVESWSDWYLSSKRIFNGVFESIKPDHSKNVSTRRNTKRKRKISLVLKISTGHGYASICLGSELKDLKQHFSHFQSIFFDEKYIVRDNPALFKHISSKISSSQAKPTTASIKKVSEHLSLNARLEKTNASVCICVVWI